MRVTVPIVIEVEVWEAKNSAKALAKALETVADRLDTQPMAERYSWSNEGCIDAFSFGGDIKHILLPLKPIPELDVEEEEVEG